MIAPRKPTADSANAAAATRPSSVGFRSAKFFCAARPQRGDDHADGRDQDRDHLQRGEMIAEKHETEDRGLDRLGLQIGRRHHERAVVHREQHQSGGEDLAERAEQQPGPERRRRPRHMVAGRDHHHGKEHQRERKAEQEADIGGAPGAERPRQLPLHRVARDLPERRDDGKGNPERGDADHGWGIRMGIGREADSHRAGRGLHGQPQRHHDGIAAWCLRTRRRSESRRRSMLQAPSATTM